MSFTQSRSRRAQAAASRDAAAGRTPAMGWNTYIRLAQGGARGGEWPRRYHAYLRSTAWSEKRAWFVALAGRACARCGAGTRLQVHHVHYRTVGEEGIADLRVVCRACHETDHAGGTESSIPMTDRQIAAWRAERAATPARPIPETPGMVRRRPGGKKLPEAL